MRRSARFLTGLLLALSASAFSLRPLAQSALKAPPVRQQAATKRPAAAPSDNNQEPDSVVRITTQLVQIDVVVTNKSGEHVDSLTDDDFELTIDGKKQPVAYFSLVKQPGAAPAVQNAPKSSNVKAPLPASSAAIRKIAPEQVRRTIAFVVDDLGLSFESTAYAREGIKKFIREQMQDGDLVGIIRTGKGLGALQQFTSDRRLLSAAAEKLHWNPVSRDMIPRFGSQPGEPPEMSDEAREANQRFEDFRETVFSVGTLGAINFVVRGLRELPGRKVVILVSDGFRLFGQNRDNTQVLDRVRHLVDLANRSSVVIYSLDAKGLLTLQPDASANLSRMSQRQITDQYAKASQALFDSQEGLNFLSKETGGFAVLNSNDLNAGVQKIMHDNQSYYLLGFDPEQQQFNGKFHSIKVRVKRPGLQVRTRSGFFGVPDAEARAKPKTRDEQILSALYSPFGARDLPIQMTSGFFNSSQGGSFVRSLLHIDASQLKFNEIENGQKELKLDIASFTFDENGKTVENVARLFTMKFDAARYKAAMEQGLFYQSDVPIQKPGAYQFRLVLRDETTEKLGSAGQFINVPDLTKGRLALSGLIMAGAAPAPAEVNPQQSEEDLQSGPAIRRFRRNGQLDYAAVIFNPTLNPANSQPQLTTQVEVYRDGKVVYQGTPRPVELAGQTDPRRIGCGGSLRLTGLPPGDYLLHLIISDELAKSKYAQADQWMDFSVR